MTFFLEARIFEIYDRFKGGFLTNLAYNFAVVDKLFLKSIIGIWINDPWNYAGKKEKCNFFAIFAMDTSKAHFFFLPIHRSNGLWHNISSVSKLYWHFTKLSLTRPLLYAMKIFQTLHSFSFSLCFCSKLRLVVALEEKTLCFQLWNSFQSAKCQSETFKDYQELERRKKCTFGTHWRKTRNKRIQFSSHIWHSVTGSKRIFEMMLKVWNLISW